MRKTQAISASVAFALLASCSPAPQLTDDEPPTPELTRDERAQLCLDRVNLALGTTWQLPSPTHETAVIFGDFNGDGHEDEACLGAQEDIENYEGFEGWQLLVHLKSNDETLRVNPLPEFSPDIPIDEMRIHREGPGEYTTRCGHMPDECAPDALLELVTTHDGIFLTVLGASGVLIYWDNDEGVFKRQWFVD